MSREGQNKAPFESKNKHHAHHHHRHAYT